MDFLKNAYEAVINKIRKEMNLEKLPIFIHGYDYAIPYPCAHNDSRAPIHAAKNKWLGAPLDQRNIIDPELRSGIIKLLIDRLYRMLQEVAGNSNQTGVWLVDCRGSMPDAADWVDEIHGTSDGFKKAAKRFLAAIKKGL
jgi:hypothetical protein